MATAPRLVRLVRVLRWYGVAVVRAVAAPCADVLHRLVRVIRRAVGRWYA